MERGDCSGKMVLARGLIMFRQKLTAGMKGRNHGVPTMIAPGEEGGATEPEF